MSPAELLSIKWEQVGEISAQDIWNLVKKLTKVEEKYKASSLLHLSSKHSYSKWPGQVGHDDWRESGHGQEARAHQPWRSHPAGLQQIDLSLAASGWRPLCRLACFVQEVVHGWFPGLCRYREALEAYSIKLRLNSSRFDIMIMTRFKSIVSSWLNISCPNNYGVMHKLVLTLNFDSPSWNSPSNKP